MIVERIAYGVGREFLFQIEMGDLAEGMHTRIRTARAGDGDGFAGKLVDRLFERALHRRPVILPLPAGKRSAVIFDGQAIAHHTSFVPRGSWKPRSKSSAFIGARPARCRRVSFSAPSPHAMVSLSSSTSPGAPLPFAGSP